MDPDCAGNRVWVRRGELHIIDAPDEEDDGDEDAAPSGDGSSRNDSGGAAASARRRARNEALVRGPLALGRALSLLRASRRWSESSGHGSGGGLAAWVGAEVELRGLKAREVRQPRIIFLRGRLGRCL